MEPMSATMAHSSSSEIVIVIVTPIAHYYSTLRGRPIALSSIFEPIRHLSKSQSRLLGQLFLVVRCWISISSVALLQLISMPLLETVYCFFAIPYCLGKRILFPDPIFVDGAQVAASDPLRLSIMCLPPEPVQLFMIFFTEAVGFQYLIDFYSWKQGKNFTIRRILLIVKKIWRNLTFEIAPVIGNMGLGP